MKATASISKTIITGAVASLLCVSGLALTACGGSNNDKSASEEPSTSTPATTTTTTKSSSTDDAVADLLNQLTEAYMGVTNDGGTVYYAGGNEGDLGVIVFLDPSTTESASWVGPLSTSGNKVTISDDANGTTLTFEVTPQDDGTILLDLGDLGAALVAQCEVSEVLDAINTIDSNTKAVA